MNNMSCRFGNIANISTTGASDETARQDGGSSRGVRASHELAKTDLERMNVYKPVIRRVSGATGMDPAVIAAIISRESRAGAALVNGWGDNGNAFGLMQVDRRWHSPVGAWNSEEHITQATNILIAFIETIQQKFPSWQREHHFKGGIAAFNAGQDSVQSYDGADSRTTGRDYSNDVVARAQWYRGNGY